MKTFLEKSLCRGTTNHFANALDHDARVVSDFAGDVKMIRPDLVCRVGPLSKEIPRVKAFCLVAPAVVLNERATFRDAIFWCELAFKWGVPSLLPWRLLEAFFVIVICRFLYYMRSFGVHSPRTAPRFIAPAV
jgi:hypothetical protein